MNKDYRYDYVRTIAILIIVIGHFNSFCLGNTSVARILGGSGFNLFFFLSALLYGLKWENSGKQPFPVLPFLAKRIIKIGSAIWPFLLFLLGAYFYAGVEFSIMDFTLNFLFLGYVRKLPGNGHLWFITIMLVIYVEFLILSKWKIGISKLLGLMASCLIMFLILEKSGIPGYCFLSIGVCAFLFYYSEQIIDFIKTKSINYVVAFFLAMNLLLLFLFFGMPEYNRLIAYPIFIALGLLWLLGLISFAPSKKNDVISFFSSISFEMYIVHHMLCEGPLFRVAYISNSSVLQFFSLLFLTIVLGYLLHIVSGVVSSSLQKI